VSLPVQRIAVCRGVHTALWLSSTRAGQMLLAEDYRSGRRPRCMCTQEGVEMYVGRRGSLYYLSRMPGSGFLHDPACESTEDANLLSGAGCYAPGALVETEEGLMRIRAALDVRGRIALPSPEVRLDGVMDLLLEQANLNRTDPDEASRSWAQVRDRLLEAAQNFLVDGASLADRLFVPEPYDRQRPGKGEAAARAFVADHHAAALLCAPLKELRHRGYSWHLTLKHLPGLDLWISDDTTAEIESRYGAPIITSPPEYALCIARVKPGRQAGNINVVNLSLRPTDKQYLPCGSALEAEIATGFRERGIGFMRPLRFDSPPDVALADYAVLSGDQAKPVFVLAPTGNPVLDEAKRATAHLMQRNHTPAIIHEIAPESPPRLTR